MVTGSFRAPSLLLICVSALAALLLACDRGNPPAEKALDPARTGGTAKRKVRVGTEAAYPPMEYIDEKTNQIVGFDIELMRAVAEHGGFEVEFVNANWDAVFGLLANREIDAIISSVTITEERKQRLGFSDPYYLSGQRLVIHGKDKDTVTRIEDLEGKTAGAQLGTTSADLLKDSYPKVKLQLYDSVPLGFTDLANGNIAGFVADDPVARYYAARMNGKPLHFVEKDYTSEEFGIVMRKDDTALQELVNKGLRTAKEQGIVEQLKDKWFR